MAWNLIKAANNKETKNGILAILISHLQAVSIQDRLGKKFSVASKSTDFEFN